MNKKGILILAICAVVVIAGSVIGVSVLRGGPDAADDNTVSTTAPGYTYDNGGYDYTQNQPVLGEQDNVLTTLQQIVQTAQDVINPNNATTKNNNKVTTKNNNKTTTKKNNNKTTTNKNNTTVSYPGDDKLVDQLIGPNGQQFLGYRYSADGDYYYTDDKDCWQKNAGYNEIYDNMAPAAAMQIDQVRIRFSYEKKDWMIQLWKGQYGWLLVGAEIGVYTAPEGTYEAGKVGTVNHYNCADKEDWLKMDMTCYWSENNTGVYKKAFHREYDEYWWATGFVKGQLTKYSKPRTELKLKARITFKSTEMANLFVEGLKESGFARAMGSNQLGDDSYFQKNADVWFLWSTKYHDCFVG